MRPLFRLQLPPMLPGLLLCLPLGLLAVLPGPLAAQSAGMPGWVVPVLRLVSATHVEPTTGVVLSEDGRVLVPADFASPGDEIIVLDGGTDIIRNGRPARLEASFPELGLEVLRVEGLRRRGAPLAATSLADGASLTLRAFPPAEQIAEGAPPLSTVTTIQVASDSETPILPAAAPLPNVTGALLDECGNLVGISLADGVQSLSPAPGTQYRWGPALRSVLTDLELPLNGSACPGSPTDESLPEPEPAALAADTVIEAPTPTPSDPAAEEPAAAEIDAGDEPELALEELPPIEDDAADRGSETVPTAADAAPAAWPWLVAALLLLAGGVLVHRARRGGRRPPAAPGDSAEGDDAPDALTRAAEAADGWSAAPPDSRLLLQGSLADGQAVEATVAVSANAINVEIGRGDCELVIGSASVSRRHARLNGTREALTLTDLGSSNGSSINGVPCLEGEIMYLEPGDTVILGDARFTLSIEAAPAGGKHR